MARLAWFSPMPPVATGIARCSMDLLPALTREHELDVFVDQDNLRRADVGGPGSPLPRLELAIRSAHDFAWQHHQRPYDLIVYQLGNSSHHDYQWPYLFRYPGLVILHDAHLHHARAACLLRAHRTEHYRIEFARSHLEVPADLAELAIAGFDNHLYYTFPMTRLVVQASRRVAVHAPALAGHLRQEAPDATIDAIRLGHGVTLSERDCAALGAAARTRYGIPRDALVFGAYGGLAPDKRLPQILAAFAGTRPYAPSIHLLCAGRVPSYYDLRADIALFGLTDHSTVTGHLETDEEFTSAIAACDVALNLRWPTAREVSGPWLRCLAAGKPTVTIDLAHLVDVPSIDPRTWQPNLGNTVPCTVAIDILDDEHSLRLAMRRLATDPPLRASLGRAGQRYWVDNHSLDVMLEDYRRLIAETIADGTRGPRPSDPLPDHLTDDGGGTLRQVMAELGLPTPFAL